MSQRFFESSAEIAASPDAVCGATVRIRSREEYSGPPLPVMWRSMRDLGPSFAQFASGLKARVERGVPDVGR